MMALRFSRNTAIREERKRLQRKESSAKLRKFRNKKEKENERILSYTGLALWLHSRYTQTSPFNANLHSPPLEGKGYLLPIVI